MVGSFYPTPASPKGEELIPSSNGKSAYPSRIKLPSHLGRAGRWVHPRLFELGKIIIEVE